MADLQKEDQLNGGQLDPEDSGELLKGLAAPVELALEGDSSDCPPRPFSEDPSQLGFVRRPMVAWLDPRQLMDTAFRVLLSGIFGAYADKRELQIALPTDSMTDRSQAKEFWLDHVADVGDGWDSTYSVASLLASKSLEVSNDDKTYRTKRGRLLVMGGDQVYPTAKRSEYSDRTLGPYRAALPCVAREQNPELFAIPGSHDWHDGLTNFMRIFCQQRWIGGWKTQQKRSYFGVKLPHDWWLWGIDIQFDTYIDVPQLDYFTNLVANHVKPGDRIILCTAKTPWLKSAREEGGVYAMRNLDYFERKVIGQSGARVAVHLSSGRHHYSRYEKEKGARQWITAGGGGAFLHPTHTLPENVELLRHGRVSPYKLAAVYPPRQASKSLRKRLWLLPLRNRRFGVLLAAAHVLMAVLLGLHVGDIHRRLGLADLVSSLGQSPPAVLLVAVVASLQTLGMIALAHEARGRRRVLFGIGHAALQLCSLAGILILASQLSSAADLAGVASIALFFVALAVLGALGGGLGMALYLWVTNYFGFHTNEAYGAIGVMDFKSFLRLHIDSTGNLTLYPIGIDKVCRRWRLQPEGPAEAPWFEPETELKPHLIEPPIRISR